MEPKAIDVVKRGKKRPTEAYDPGKLYASIYACCLSVRSQDGLADDTARHVCTVVTSWCTDKPIITTVDIRERAAKALLGLHPDAAYVYKNYQKII
ncbi:MAG: hypothetical protein ABI397_01125 [Candidatus Saccharimonas sp.]